MPYRYSRAFLRTVKGPDSPVPDLYPYPYLRYRNPYLRKPY
jgi:hypothetical protein